MLSIVLHPADVTGFFNEAVANKTEGLIMRLSWLKPNVGKQRVLYIKT